MYIAAPFLQDTAMSYFKDAETAAKESPFATHEICMCCGKAAAGPTVAYDLTLPGGDLLTRALFHRDCAFAMAQRIIYDAWPNRRDGEWMQNNR